MATNGAHGPVRFGDDPTGLVWLDSDEPETTYTLVEVERGPSGRFEDGQYELLLHGDMIAQGDARAVIVELQTHRQYMAISQVEMRLVDGRRCIYRHRPPGDDTSPIIWRSGEH